MYTDYLYNSPNSLKYNKVLIIYKSSVKRIREKYAGLFWPRHYYVNITSSVVLCTIVTTCSVVLCTIITTCSTVYHHYYLFRGTVYHHYYLFRGTAYHHYYLFHCVTSLLPVPWYHHYYLFPGTMYQYTLLCTIITTCSLVPCTSTPCFVPSLLSVPWYHVPVHPAWYHHSNRVT